MVDTKGVAGTMKATAQEGQLDRMETILIETLESLQVLGDQVESLKLNLEGLTDELDELNDQLEEVVFRKDYES